MKRDTYRGSVSVSCSDYRGVQDRPEEGVVAKRTDVDLPGDQTRLPKVRLRMATTLSTGVTGSVDEHPNQDFVHYSSVSKGLYLKRENLRVTSTTINVNSRYLTVIEMVTLEVLNKLQERIRTSLGVCLKGFL